MYGAWVDTRHAQDILKHAGLILPHLPANHRHPDAWFDSIEEADPHSLSGKVRHTTVVPDSGHYLGTTCIFMRADHKCALQVAAEENGLHPWRFKPFYCILHPLDIDEQGRITLDDFEALLAEPASCLRPSPTPIPLKHTFSQELDYLVGRVQKNLGPGD